MSSSEQMVAWLTELGSPLPAVIPLAINQVAPGLVVQGYRAPGLMMRSTSCTAVSAPGAAGQEGPWPGQADRVPGADVDWA